LNPCQLPAGFMTGLFLGWLFIRTVAAEAGGYRGMNG